jgi:hypothetical protein
MTSIIENADAYDLRASELVVATCQRNSSTLQLELRSPTETWTLIVEGRWSVRSDRSGAEAVPSPEVSDLVGESVRLIRARKVDGELEMKLTHWIVIVEPDNDYEAWQMYSSNGERLIAVPGDGIAVWRTGRQITT